MSSFPKTLLLKQKKSRKQLLTKQKYFASATHTALQEHSTAKKSILDLLEFCQKKDIIFSVDENYIEFAEKGRRQPLAGLVKDYENLFVIRSVTKFYGMAGIRLGYGIATNNLVDKLENVRIPWSINSLAASRLLQRLMTPNSFKTPRQQCQRKSHSLPKA